MGRPVIKWLFFVAILFISLFFYWIKHAYLLLYGTAEVIIAILLMLVTIFPAEIYRLLYQHQPPQDRFIDLITKTAITFGTVYVLVNGLDDIDKALKALNMARNHMELAD